ncbi:MAG: DUF6090 family protein, partial [Planctomycetota bacterium]
MLRSLRKIRAKLLAEGKTGRYLRYAIGELILVVIGILIALQLNTANQSRIKNNRLSEYAHALHADLEADLMMLAPIIREMESIRSRAKELGEYVMGRDIEEISNLDLFYLMRAPFYRPYMWNSTTIDQMKASGVLGQMPNRELAGKITAYEALKRHLEDDYRFDLSWGIEAENLAMQIVDMNYPGYEQVFTPYLDNGSTPFLEPGDRFPNTRLHARYKDVELDLL